MTIPFTKPWISGKEVGFINEIARTPVYAGGGRFTTLCEGWLKTLLDCEQAMLTSSCTAALEIAALLLDIQPGDEVILPSYTFVSTANAFVMRGATPVFVDIELGTLNIDASLIEAAITSRTKAIIVVHYAGVACDMDRIRQIANHHQLCLIEDAAHAVGAHHGDQALGSIGHLATFSFHQTKNLHCGEGGALIINDRKFIERAEILREKGTNRTAFTRGEISEYQWVDLGHSHMPSEISAAFLWGQIAEHESIALSRLQTWESYQSAFLPLARDHGFDCPDIPGQSRHNAHIYHLLMDSAESRSTLMQWLNECGIQAVTHYAPLHASPAGQRHGRASGLLENTLQAHARSIRLPLWTHMPTADSNRVIEAVQEFFNSR